MPTPTLDQAARYLKIRALAERASGAEAEAAERRLLALEQEYPGVGRLAERVKAAEEAHARGGAPPFDGAFDGPPVPGLDAFVDGLSGRRPMSFWQRFQAAVEGGVTLGPELARAFGESMDALDDTPPPLAPGRAEVLLRENANGELVVTVRVQAATAASQTGQRRIANMVRRRLRGWSMG